MKKGLILALFVASCFGTMLAQDKDTEKDSKNEGNYTLSVPKEKFEVFAGGEFRHIGNSVIFNPFREHSFDFGGGEVALTYKFTPKFGITGDTDGWFNNNVHSIMVGPTYYVWKGGFLHALVGTTGKHIFNTGVGVALGGGYDVPIGNSRFAIRAVQVDYMLSRAPVAHVGPSDGLRVSTGVIIKF